MSFLSKFKKIIKDNEKSPTTKILFSCEVNVISLVAEAIFMKMIESDIDVQSTGNMEFSDENLKQSALKACEEYGINLSKHSSKSFFDISFDELNLILTATIKERDRLRYTYPSLNIHTIREYAGFSDMDLIDYHGEINFKNLFSRLVESFEKIIRSNNWNLNELFLNEFNKSLKNANPYNFKYLDDLIHSSDEHIVLNTDITLDETESSQYLNGINLDRDLLVIDGNAHVLDANNRTPIFKITGRNIVLKNIVFKNSFSNNIAAIFNSGKVKFIKCKFIDNYSQITGAIINSGNLTLIDCSFNDNKSSVGGGAINNQPDGTVLIEDTHFSSNFSQDGCGALINFGNATIKNSFFTDNTTNGEGGAINNQKSGEVNIFNTTFENNRGNENGGALINMGKLSIEESTFENNHTCAFGGAIYNDAGSVLKANKAKFLRSDAGRDAAVLYNLSFDMEMDKCTVLENNTDKNLILNKNNLKCMRSIFIKNHSNSIIMNESTISIDNTKFIENSSHETVIYNKGQSCDIFKSHFKENSSLLNPNYGYDAVNEYELGLSLPETFNKGGILNKNHIIAKKLTEDEVKFLIKNIDRGYVDIIGKISKFNFRHICDLIQTRENDFITLDEDITLDDSDLYFFEGGIELNIDGVTVDGNGHIIDADSKSRIFIITGRNVTLKNIIFKNGRFINTQEEPYSGGGALVIVKGASLNLENCRFINNQSDTNGGALLNNGSVISKSSAFNNNSCELYGGAIYNNGNLNANDCSFNANRSKIGSAVFNKNECIFEHIQISDDLPDLIYNTGFILPGNVSSDLIYNLGRIHEKPVQNESFSYLNDLIKNSGIIELKTDIIFDYRIDEMLKDGMLIDKNLIIEGNGHVIDGNDSSAFFNVINEVAAVTLKDITFKNGYSSQKSLIENYANLNVENCRFIDNHSFSDVSLIDNMGKMSISNSILANNNSRTNSIINNNSKLQIVESIVMNNYSKARGTALFNSNDAGVKSCRFLGNLSKRDGGCINNQLGSKIKVSDTYFNGNSAEVSGGVLINWGSVEAVNCEFNHNYSKLNCGVIDNQAQAIISIHDSRFNHNKTKKNAGAIGNYGKLTIDDSIFKNNFANFDGGAVVNWNTFDLNNSEFIENTCSNDGGAINNQGQTIINMKDITFNLNAAGHLGGAILNHGEIRIDKSFFNDNTCELEGGAINNQNGFINSINTAFSENHASLGGALINNEKMRLEKCIFNKNFSTEFGGAIVNMDAMIVSVCEFRSNQSKYGGAVFTHSKNVQMNDCIFEDNLPDDVLG